MAARPLLGFVALVLLAGSILLVLFVLLAGAIDASPSNKVFFLSADTSNIPGAPKTAHWTLWNVCSGSGSVNTKCGGVHPAYPFDPPRNFGTEKGIDSEFIGTHKFYYLTRFMFSFVLIELVFAVIALFLGISALCTRIGSYISSFLCALSLIFQSLVAALMTSAYVMGRNAFRSNNRSAEIGKYAFGFVWAAWAALLLATILFCAGGSASKGESGGGLFRRKKTTSRSRGMFFGTGDAETSSFHRHER